jgi:hypothetical protein
MVIQIVGFLTALSVIAGIVIAFLVKSKKCSLTTFFRAGIIVVAASIVLMIVSFLLQIIFLVAIPVLLIGLIYILIGARKRNQHPELSSKK